MDWLNWISTVLFDSQGFGVLLLWGLGVVVLAYLGIGLGIRRILRGPHVYNRWAGREVSKKRDAEIVAAVERAYGGAPEPWTGDARIDAVIEGDVEYSRVSREIYGTDDAFEQARLSSNAAGATSPDVQR